MSVDAFIAIAGRLPEAMLRVATDGTIAVANGAAGRIVHRRADELAGRRIAELLDDPPEQVARALRTWSRSADPLAFRLRWRTAPARAAIDRNAASQTRLIEDLLDVSRIISGKLKLDVRPAELAPIVSAAIDAVHPAADGKRLRIVSAGPESLGPVTADSGRLQQVVWNLLSNSVKFTPPGAEISVAVTRRNGDVRIAVSDTGIGIDPAMLPYVFERFRQADSSTTRHHGGLGLALVRHLVELHGGTVDVRSDGRDKGAVLTVTLPAGAPDTRPTPATRTAASSVVADHAALSAPRSSPSR